MPAGIFLTVQDVSSSLLVTGYSLFVCSTDEYTSTRVTSSYVRAHQLADGLPDHFAVAHLHVAAHDRANRHAFHLPAVPRAGLVLAVELVDVDDALLVHVDDRNIPVGAQPDSPLLRIALPHLGGIFRGDFDVVVQRHPPLVDLGQHRRHRGLDAAEAGDAIPDRRLGHLAIEVRPFLIQSVGRMVGGDHVYVAVQEPVTQDLLMVPAAHRGIHLEQRPDLFHKNG